MGVGIARLPKPGAETEARGASTESVLSTIGSQWTRLDEALVVWEESERAARSIGLSVQTAAEEPRVEDLRLVTQVGRVFEHRHPGVPVVLDKGRYLIVRLDGDQARRVEADDVCYRVRPLAGGQTVFRTVAPVARASVPWVQTLVSEVSQRTLEDHLTRLAGFPTRHSLSEEFAEVASWAQEELGRLQFATRTERVSVGSGTSLNVIADRPGEGPEPRGLIVVCAHLDSINLKGPSEPAPGADDNGSGAAALLEIGRVLASDGARHDLRLILFGGEEQGLHGSRQHVEALLASDRRRIRAVVNMDMVATLNTPAATVLLEGSPVSRALIDDLGAAAATYTNLVVQTSLSPFASDHVPFIDEGMPAVLTIEGADRGNGNVHTAQDTLAHIDYGLALEITRMNVAACATALAESTRRQ